MSTAADSGFGFADPDDCSRARQVFDRAGYSEEGFRAALGAACILTPTATQLPLWLCRTRGATPLHTLIRLFSFGVPVDTDAARRALDPMPLETWAGAGLL